MCQSLNLSVTSRSATTIVLAAFFGATISSAAYLPNNTGIIGLLMVKDMGVPFTWLGFYSENLPYQIGTRCWPIPSCTFSAGVSLASTFPAAALVPKRNSPLSAR